MRQLHLLVGFLVAFSLPVSANDHEAPERALDLNYGAMLYEYYQGHHFAALTALNVARLRGGIAGHGDHPALVEGGLMLSYGLTRDARAVFELLLQDSSSESVSPSSRNQAWFYLGKVFYLEQDYAAALDALEKVDGVLLQQNKPLLFEEWHYLQGQIYRSQNRNQAGLNTQITQLPAGSLWRAYLRYNQAVMLAGQQPELSVSQLQLLSRDLQVGLVKKDSDYLERQALRDQSLLTLGQLQLQLAQYDSALESLKQIHLDSAFSDQALFAYAVAASHLEQFGLALQALNTLRDRALFTPWLQQVPYALAYLYEQLNQPELALQAYQAAAVHYQQLSAQLALDHQTLTGQKILAALALEDSTALQLGAEQLTPDAYGRLKVQPADFNLAGLLSTEPFQLALRDLHELYKLKSSLSQWQHQLDSFSLMIDTREQERQQGIRETAAEIEAQQAEHWISRQQAYLDAIQQAKVEENAEFFASEQQLEFKRQIQSVVDTLNDFPEGEEKAQFSQKIKRIQAYYDWWIADQYGVNLWQAEKQMIGLNRAIEEFRARHSTLEQHMQSNRQNAELANRVIEGRERLINLSQQLDQRLHEARAELIKLVRQDLDVRSAETREYLLAARQAQARLSDQLYRQARTAPEAVNEPDKTAEAVP